MNSDGEIYHVAQNGNQAPKNPLPCADLTKICLSARNDTEKATRLTFIQRRKNLRIWGYERVIQRFVEESPEVYLLVMTFGHWVTMESAKIRVRRFFERRISEVVESHIRIMEMHRSGRPHANLLLRLAENVMAIRRIENAVHDYGRRYGIGVYYFEPVKSAVGISKYIVKELSKPHEGRGFSCSPDVKRFRYESNREEWIRGRALFMEKNGFGTFEEATQKLGLLWPARYAVEIKILGKQRRAS